MKQYIVDAFTNEPFSGNPETVLDKTIIEAYQASKRGGYLLALRTRSIPRSEELGQCKRRK